MTDQTLKIRIKLQTPQDAITDEPKSIDDIFGESLKPTQHGTKRVPTAVKLWVLFGFLFLIGTVCYLSLRSQHTAPARYTIIDTPIVSHSGSDQLQRAPIADTSEPSSPAVGAWNPSSNSPEQHLQRSSEIEGLDQETPEISNDSPDSKNPNSNDDKPAFEFSAREEIPLPRSTSAMANSEPLSDQTDQALTSPTSERQTASSLASAMDNEPSENEEANTQAESPPIDTAAPSSESPVSINIVRAQLTNSVKNREPVDLIKGTVSADGQSLKRLFYFTEFRNMQGQTLSHRWIHEGKTFAEVNFNVRGNRWRVYSSKYLTPSMAGDWQILLVDAGGKALKTERFTFIP